MDMSSLSIEELGKFYDLLDELGDVVAKKENIIKNMALTDVKKMNEALEVRNKSNEKASKFTIEDLSMSRNIDEIKNIVTNSLDSSYEMHEIDENARNLNSDLDELVEREERIKDEIKELVRISTNETKKNSKLEVMNTIVDIIDKKSPKTVSNISPDLCRIIECTKELIKEIAELYDKNKSVPESAIDIDVYKNFKKLKERAIEYEQEKNKSDDRQLEMLKKPESTVEKLKVELPSEEKPTLEIPSEEKTAIEEKIVVEPKEEPVPLEKKIEVDSLESLENLQKQESVKKEQPDSLLTLDSLLNAQQPKEEPVNNNASDRVLLMKNNVDPDLVRAARTKKSKLAKIHSNTVGSYSPTRIIQYEDYGKVNTQEPGFNLDSFINQTAA